jgi:hypothetical protein
MARGKKPSAAANEEEPAVDLDPEFDLGPDFDADRDMGDIKYREARRSGPGTAARRALEALAESRRLNRELRDLEDFEI